MGKIYQSADSVLVWLGRPEDTKATRQSDGLPTLRFLYDILIGDGHPTDRMVESIGDPTHWENLLGLAVLCELPYCIGTDFGLFKRLSWLLSWRSITASHQSIREYSFRYENI